MSSTKKDNSHIKLDGRQEGKFQAWLRMNGIDPDTWFKETTDEEFEEMGEQK